MATRTKVSKTSQISRIASIEALIILFRLQPDLKQAEGPGRRSGPSIGTTTPKSRSTAPDTVNSRQPLAEVPVAITVSTPRGDIRVMDPAAFRSHFGTEPPDISHGARLAAVQFRVRDRAALNAALKAGGIAASSRMGATIVAPETAIGATLVFD